MNISAHFIGCFWSWQGVEKFDILLDNVFDKRFVVFEEFVFNNIFRLPDNLPITLSHNKVNHRVLGGSNMITRIKVITKM